MRSEMDELIAKVTETLSKQGGEGTVGDARRATGKKAADYILQEMKQRGLIIWLDFNRYQLATGRWATPEVIAMAKRDAKPRKVRRGRGSY